jgi:predicted dehydrogenase
VSPAAQRKISFGLIGLGRHGSRYAAHLLHDVPRARLVAVCRRERDAGRAFARQHGLAFYDDYRRLIEDPAVEAIAVAVSPDLHPDICRRAVDAGKHILLEKPLARNLAEGCQILELVEGIGIKFMLAQTLRFNSVVREIKKQLGRLGRIHMLTFNQRMEHHDLAWLDDPEVAGGGNILHTGVHIFDMIHFLVEEEVAWAWCRWEHIFHPHTEDLFAAVMGLQGRKTICLIDSCKVTGGRSGRIEVVGEKGQLVGDHVLGTLSLIEGRHAVPLEPQPPVHTVQEILETFVDCLLTDGDPPITAQDGMRTLRAAQLCYRSAESGRVVRAEEIGD